MPGEVEWVFLEPRRMLGPDTAARLQEIRAKQVKILRAPGTRSFWSEWISSRQVLPMDARVESSLVEVAQMLPAAVSLEALADSARLSVHRFGHLFAEQMGVSLQRYVLWRRLLHAARLLGTGSDATVAAHEAGFADSAHLARTFRATFGITAGPALLRRR